MKILFIYPNKAMVTRMPLGMCYLVAHLKNAGHEVKVFDTTFIKCGAGKNEEELRESSLQVKNPNIKEYGMVEEELDVFDELEKVTESFKPDIVGISIADPNYQFGLQLLKQIRGNAPQIPIIAGGPTPTLAPDEVMAEDCIDMICVGEGEEAICELCDKLERGGDIKNIKNIWVKKDGKIYKNPIRELKDLDDILAPDLDVLDKRHFIRPLGGKMYTMATVMWTRGCLFDCKYCANSSFVKLYQNKGKFYRIKNPEQIIKELLDWKQKYNINFFFFVDDIFPLHRPEIIDEFCKLYKEHINLPFSINLQPTLVKEEQLAKVIDAGCCNICVGLESGNRGIREKVLGRVYEDEQVIRVFNLAKKYGIRSSSFNIIGLPYETRENILETIELNRKANPTSATVTFFHPYRGSVLREQCIRENLFNPATEKTNKDTLYREEVNLDLPQISKNEVKGLFKTFQLYFKLPKEYYGLIKVAEGENEIAEEVYSKILKPKFDAITKKESEWDFTKKPYN